MRLTSTQNLILAFVAGCVVTYILLGGRRPRWSRYEAFQGDAAGCPVCGSGAAGTEASTPSTPSCSQCGGAYPCPDHKETAAPTCLCPPMPDMSKYVLKSSIPPPPVCPDMSNYMLKSECPPVPDMSQYVLKSSIPKPQPIIIDTSADMKSKCGECPPCPRPRCPEVKCPPATVCPACPPCPRAACPQTQVKCRAEEIASNPIRPFLAPLGVPGFG